MENWIAQWFIEGHLAGCSWRLEELEAKRNRNYGCMASCWAYWLFDGNEGMEKKHEHSHSHGDYAVATVGIPSSIAYQQPVSSEYRVLRQHCCKASMKSMI